MAARKRKRYVEKGPAGRNYLTDEGRAYAERKIAAGAHVPDLAEEMGRGVTPSMLYALRRRENGEDAPALPTRAAGGKSAAAKALVPVLYACPHCGGRVRPA